MGGGRGGEEGEGRLGKERRMKRWEEGKEEK